MGKKQQDNSKYIENILFILLILGIIAFFGLIIRNIILGDFAFWYDPARDMLLGLDNLKKISLIGPPSGIPGLFYGPYWIWQISVAEFISRDPRWVVFFVSTLPYLILFPLVLLFFTDISNKIITVALWGLFIVSFQYYIQLWNPDIAPLLYLTLLAVLSKIAFFSKNKLNWKLIFVSGCIAGLIMNFHISFGLGIVISTGFLLIFEMLLVFFLYRNMISKLILNRIMGIISYSLGVFIIFGPFLLFEVRHGFNQIQSVLFTLKRAVIDDSAIVGQVGLKKDEIFKNFYYSGEKLFHIPWFIVAILFLFLLILFIYDIYKKKHIFSYSDKKILAILFINFFILSLIYLKSKNPVWGYHFIAVEIMYLVVLGLIIKKDKWAQYGIAVFVLILLGIKLYSSATTLNNPSLDSNYRLKKLAINTIFNDKKNKDFTLTIYDPAIYTFDYDYILRMDEMEGKIIPDKKVVKNKIAYLIIPKTDTVTKEAFINYNTPNLLYKTVRAWKLEDQTLVLRRELK